MRAFSAGQLALRSQSSELLHLDTLRFIASAGIVLHHSKEYFLDPTSRIAAGERSVGLALFVDLFFVISGYVIAYVYAERINSWAQYGTFMQRRVGRLVPLHWLTLVLAMAASFAFLQAGGNPHHPVIFSAPCIAETAVLLQGILTCNGTIFNGQSWSISAEMGMYLCFPLFSFLGHKNRWLPALIGLVAFLCLASLELRSTYPLNSWVYLIVGVVRAVPSFVLGVGFWFLRDPIKLLPAARPILGIALISLLYLMFLKPSLLALPLIYLVALSAIAADLQRKAGKIVILCAPLGQLTYSIYMWHGLIILFLMNVVGDKLLHGKLIYMVPLAFLSYLLVFIWSFVSFRYIESPARRWVDSLSLFERRVPQRSPAKA